MALPVPAHGYVRRQQRRARYRMLTDAVLTHGLRLRIRRHVRRVGSRAYANQAWRTTQQLHTPQRHRYRTIMLNQQVLGWVITQGKGLEGQV